MLNVSLRYFALSLTLLCVFNQVDTASRDNSPRRERGNPKRTYYNYQTPPSLKNQSLAQMYATKTKAEIIKELNKNFRRLPAELHPDIAYQIVFENPLLSLQERLEILRYLYDNETDKQNRDLFMFLRDGTNILRTSYPHDQTPLKSATFSLAKITEAAPLSKVLTWLTFAIYENNLTAVRFLIEHDLNPAFKVWDTNESALDLAKKLGNNTIIDILNTAISENQFSPYDITSTSTMNEPYMDLTETGSN